MQDHRNKLSSKNFGSSEHLYTLTLTKKRSRDEDIYNNTWNDIKRIEEMLSLFDSVQDWTLE